MKIAVTGHRPNKLGGYQAYDNFRAIRRHMRDFLQSYLGRAELISGGALGVDQFWIEVGLYLGFDVIVALPFPGYNAYWPPASQEKYQALLDKCSDVRYICEAGFEGWKLQRRNEWMVDNCDLLVAYWTGQSGGTSNCLAHARNVGRETRIFKIQRQTNGIQFETIQLDK